MNIWETYPFIDMTGNPAYRENVFVNEKNPYSAGSTHDKVYQLLYDIVREELCEENLSGISWEESKRQMNEGKIGCIAIGSWALSQFKNAGENADDIAFMPFPNQVEGKQYATISTDYCYAVNCHSDNKEAARAYVDFMLNDSGYALDNDTLSIVKSDSYPDSYKDMKEVTLLSNETAVAENSGKYDILSTNLNLTDGKEQKRIMEAAAGKRNESLDEILLDWDERWESSRTADMKVQNHIFEFSGDDIELNQYEVSFSEGELSYLDGIEKVKVGYLRNFAPFEYEKSGSFQGVAADVCSIFSEQMKIPFEYYPYDNYSQMVEAIENGKIDLIAGIENISAFSDRIRLSKEYIDFNNVIVKNKSVKLDEMEKRRAAVIKGNESDYFQNLDKMVWEDTLLEAVNQVNQLKADYTVTNNYSANYYIWQAEYDNVTILPTINQNGMYLGFSRNADIRWIAICNKCIYSIPESRIELMLLNNIDPPAQKITLTRLIEIYPMQSIICLAVAFAMIILIVFWVYKEKAQNARKHELDAKRYQILSDLTDEYVFEYNCEKNLLQFDKKFSENFGFAREVDLEQYQEDNSKLNIFIQHFRELKEQKSKNSEIFFYEQGKKVLWYRLIVSRIYDNKQHLIQMIGKVVSVQQEMEEKQEILKKAEKDPLTGLFNREGFYSVFERLQSTGAEGGNYVMAILDMDNFKAVNDTLGHLGGDAALKLLGKELTEIFEGSGIVARYGGDEFIVCIPRVQDREEILNLLKRLVSQMNRVLVYQEKERMLSISLGAVMVKNRTSLEQALKWADEELYKVKQQGRNGYRLVDKETLEA